MKRYFALIFLIIASFAGIMIGCTNNAYSNLSYSLTYGETNTPLNVNDGVTIVYDKDQNAKLLLGYKINGIKNINPKIVVSSDNREVVVPENLTSSNGSGNFYLVALQPGTANIKISSVENTSKFVTFKVVVTYPLTEISTTLAADEVLVISKGMSLDLNKYLSFKPNQPYETTEKSVSFEIVENIAGRVFTLENGVLFTDNTLTANGSVTVRVRSTIRTGIYKDIVIYFMPALNASDISIENLNTTESLSSSNGIKLISHNEQYNLNKIRTIINAPYYLVDVLATVSDAGIANVENDASSSGITLYNGIIQSSNRVFDVSVASGKSGNTNLRLSYFPSQVYIRTGDGISILKIKNATEGFNTSIPLNVLSLPTEITATTLNVSASTSERVSLENNFVIYDDYGNQSGKLLNFYFKSYSSVAAANTKIKVGFSRAGTLITDPSNLFVISNNKNISISANAEGYFYLDSQTDYYLKAKSAALGGFVYSLTAESVLDNLPVNATGLTVSKSFSFSCETGVNNIIINGKQELLPVVYMLNGKDSNLNIAVNDTATTSHISHEILSGASLIRISKTAEGYNVSAINKGEVKIRFYAPNGYQKILTIRIVSEFTGAALSVDKVTGYSNITVADYNETTNSLKSMMIKDGNTFNLYADFLPSQASLTEISFSAINKTTNESSLDINFSSYLVNSNTSNNIFDTIAQISVPNLDSNTSKAYIIKATFSYMEFVKQEGSEFYAESLKQSTYEFDLIVFKPSSDIYLETTQKDLYAADDLGYYNSDAAILEFSTVIKGIGLNITNYSFVLQQLGLSENYYINIKKAGTFEALNGIAISFVIKNESGVYSAVALDSEGNEYSPFDIRLNEISGGVSLTIFIQAINTSANNSVVLKMSVSEFGLSKDLYSSINIKRAVLTQNVIATGNYSTADNGTKVYDVRVSQEENIGVITSPSYVTFSGYKYFVLESETKDSFGTTINKIWVLDSNIYLTINSSGKIVSRKSGTTEILIISNDSIKNLREDGKLVTQISGGEIIAGSTLRKTPAFELVKVSISDGTVNAPYVVKTPAELLAVTEQNVLYGYTQKTYYALGANIDMGGISFEPIGGAEGFSNHLNGYNAQHAKMYKITNISYKNEDFSGNFGLFSKINANAEVVNLFVSAKSIDILSKTITSKIEYNLGVLAAVNEGYIENCSVSFTGFIYKNNIDNSAYLTVNLGGLVGKNTGVIINSTYRKTSGISLLSDYLASQESYSVPSALQYMKDENLTKENLLSSLVTASGSMYVSSQTGANINVGGLVGNLQNELYGIYSIYVNNPSTKNEADYVNSASFESQGIDSTVSINRNNDYVLKNANVGGVAGLATAGIYGAASGGYIGQIKATDFSYNILGNVGGLIGYANSLSSAKNTVYNCLSSTYLVAKGNIGGLIGSAKNIIINESKVEAYQFRYLESSNASLIRASGNIGGVAGYIENSEINNSFVRSYLNNFVDYNGSVSTGKNWGDIFVNTNDSSENYVGALVGVIENELKIYKAYTFLNMQLATINSKFNGLITGFIGKASDNCKISTEVFYTYVNMKLKADSFNGSFNDQVYALGYFEGENITKSFSQGYVEVFVNDELKQTNEGFGEKIEVIKNLNIDLSDSYNQTTKKFTFNGKTYTYDNSNNTLIVDADAETITISNNKFEVIINDKTTEFIFGYVLYAGTYEMCLTTSGADEIYYLDNISGNNYYFVYDGVIIYVTVSDTLETNAEQVGVSTYNLSKFDLKIAAEFSQVDLYDYDDNGEIIGDPYQADIVEFYVNDNTYSTITLFTDEIEGLVLELNIGGVNLTINFSVDKSSITSVQYEVVNLISATYNTSRISAINSYSSSFEIGNSIVSITFPAEYIVKVIASEVTVETITDYTFNETENTITFNYKIDGVNDTLITYNVATGILSFSFNSNDYSYSLKGSSYGENPDNTFTSGLSTYTLDFLIDIADEIAFKSPENWSNESKYTYANNNRPVIMITPERPLLSFFPTSIDIVPNTNVVTKNIQQQRTTIEEVENKYITTYFVGDNDAVENETGKEDVSLTKPAEIILYYTMSNSDTTKLTKDQVTALNTYSLNHILSLIAAPENIGKIRIICDYNTNILSIDSRGNLIVLGTGEAIIEFYSLLNIAATDSIKIKVINYITDFEIYDDPSSALNVNDSMKQYNLTIGDNITLYPKLFNNNNIVSSSNIVYKYTIEAKNKTNETMPTITNHLLSIPEGVEEDTYYVNAEIYYNYEGLEIPIYTEGFKFEFSVVLGVKSVYSTTSYLEISPMESGNINVILDSNVSGDTLSFEILDASGKIINKDDPLYGGIKVTIPTGDKLYVVRVEIDEDYKYITESREYTIKFYAKSEADKGNITQSCEVEIKFVPQVLRGISSYLYAFEGLQNFSSDKATYVFETEQTFKMLPGRYALIEIDAYPHYANIDSIVLSSSSNTGCILSFEQMLLVNDDGTQDSYYSYGFGTFNGEITLNLASIYDSPNSFTYNGKIYVRVITPAEIYENTVFTITITGVSTNYSTNQIVTVNDNFDINVNKTRGISLSANRNQIVKDIDVDDYIELSYTIIPADEVINQNDVFYSVSKVVRNGAELSNVDGIGEIIFGPNSVDYFKLGLNAEIGDIITISAEIRTIVEGETIINTSSQNIEVVDYFIKSVTVKEVTDGTIKLMVSNSKRLEATITGVGSQEKKAQIEKTVSRLLSGGVSATWQIVEGESFTNIESGSYLPFTVSKTNFSSLEALFTITGKSASISPTNLRLAFGYNYAGGEININPYGELHNIGAFIVNFKVAIYLDATADNPLPISTAADFYAMSADQDYILLNDITLERHKAFDVNVKSLDGNNKIITIDGFEYDTNPAAVSTIDIGLFRNVSANTILKNLIVALPANMDAPMVLYNYSQINFGGIATSNQGIITNCDVIAINNTKGENSYVLNIKTNSSIDGVIVNAVVGGFFADNSGIITNSRVGNDDVKIVVLDENSYIVKEERSLENIHRFLIKLNGNAQVGGFGGTNSGIVSNSYAKNIQIENESISGTIFQKTAGFLIENTSTGKVTGCYAAGWEENLNIDNDNAQEYDSPSINRRLGGGIFATGNAGGFVYQNNGTISDAYSSLNLAGTNSKPNTQLNVGGFVYSNGSSGIIERAYSNSKIRSGTNNGPFVGIDAAQTLLNEGTIEQCYYLVEKGENIYKEQDPAIMISETSVDDISEDISISSNGFNSEGSFGGFSFDINSNKYFEGMQSGGIWAIKDVVDTSSSAEGNPKTGGYPELISANTTSISLRFFSSFDNNEEKYNYIYATGYEKGSAKNPLLIDKALQLNEVFSAYYDMLANNSIEFEAKYEGSIRLINNLDFAADFEDIKEIASSEFTLTSTSELKTVFEGNNLTIDNISLSTEEYKDSYGLFKGMYGIGIKNLNLNVIGIEAGNTKAVGALAGTIVDCDISNVSVAAKNLNSKIIGHNYVGAIAGIITSGEVVADEVVAGETENDNSSGTRFISNISSNIGVIATYESADYSYISSGDIWQAIIPPYVSTNGRSPDTDLKFKELRADVSYAGGIAGVIDLTQDFTIFDDEDDYIGEIYEINVKDVTSVSKVNNINSYTNVTAVNAGGIFGFVGNQTYVQGAYFEVYSEDNNFIAGDFVSGGIAAVNYGRLSQVAVTHPLDVQLVYDDNIAMFVNGGISTANTGKNNLFQGTAKYIGGLVGINSYDQNLQSGVISDSYNRVDVRNTSAKYVGGIAGVSYDGLISTVYTTAALLGSSTSIIGGIVGSYIKSSTEIYLGTSDDQNTLEINAAKALNVWAYSDFTALKTINDNKKVGSIIGGESQEDKVWLSPTTNVYIRNDNGEAVIYENYTRTLNVNSCIIIDSNGISSGISALGFKRLMNFTSEGQVSTERSLSFPSNEWRPQQWLLSLDFVLPVLRYGQELPVERIYTANDFLKIKNRPTSNTIYVIMNDIDMSLVYGETDKSVLVSGNFMGKLYGNTKILGRNPILFNLKLEDQLKNQFPYLIRQQMQNLKILIFKLQASLLTNQKNKQFWLKRQIELILKIFEFLV